MTAPLINTRITMGLCNSCLSEGERDAAREVVRQLREKVLCGDFVCAKNILEKWMKPHDVLVMFVSSTFTDTMIERNILLQNILPELRKKEENKVLKRGL